MNTRRVFCCGRRGRACQPVESAGAHFCASAPLCPGVFAPLSRCSAAPFAPQCPLRVLTPQDLVCVRTFGRLEWPVRTVSFSHDSAFIASGSEDPQVDIAEVETSKQVRATPRIPESHAHALHVCAYRPTHPVFGISRLRYTHHHTHAHAHAHTHVHLHVHVHLHLHLHIQRYHMCMHMCMSRAVRIKHTHMQVHSIPCSAPMNSVSWHPTRHLLAYAGDDKTKSGQDEGSLRVFGFS